MSKELLAVLVVTIAIVGVFWLERQKGKFFNVLLTWLPAILFAYLIPAFFTHSFGWELSDVRLHDLSRHILIPFAILAVMSALPFRQLRQVGAKPIILFVSGSFAIAILPVLLVWIAGIIDPAGKELFIERAYWKGLVPIVGGWIGGSTSQLVLKELANTEEALFLSVLVLDNILVNIWTILMFQFIQRSDGMNRFWKINAQIPDIRPPDSGVKPFQPVVCVVVLMVLVATSFMLKMNFLLMVIVMSVLGLLMGNFVKRWNIPFVLKAGAVAIVSIMAILGLKLNFANLSLPLPFILVVIIWLILHFLIMMLVALGLRINLAWVPIGSMANLGGISTAPAVTAAYSKKLMPHAILLAILSMVSGTTWGMLTIALFELF